MVRRKVWKQVVVPPQVPVKREGKCFVSSVELLAWAKANGCQWDYNTGRPWQQLFSSVPGGRPFYHSYSSYYCGYKQAPKRIHTTRRKQPTPSEAGRLLRRAFNRRLID